MFEMNHRVKLKLFKLKDIYYAKEIQEKHPGYDAVYYFNCQQSMDMYIRVGNAKEFKTLLIDLTRQPDEILNSFRKSTKLDIKKVLWDKQVHFLINENPAKDDLNCYCQEHQAFIEQKNIQLPDWRPINQFWEHGKTVIASAFVEGEAVCRFLLINEEEKMICYYGYNRRFAYKNNADKVRLIARCNRGLEYYCMLYARKQGKKYYDLCGLTLDDCSLSIQNVDQYKMGFHGEVTTEYHFILPVTLKGKLFCWLKSTIG